MAAAGERKHLWIVPKRLLPRAADYPLLLILLLINFLPVFSPRVVPVDDTMYGFQVFANNYAEFLDSGDVVRWLPYGMYGLPAAFDQVIGLSPMCYLVGLVGAVSGLRDTLLLFKIAILGEQILFLTGLYLLAKNIYESRLCRWLVCAVAVLTISWLTQFWWDWRIYYLLPYILYFLLRFFRQQKPIYLWLAGLSAIASLLGSLIYFAPLLLFLLFLATCVLALDHRVALRSLLKPSWSNGLGLLVLTLGGAAYAWQTYHCLDDFALMIAGRDPVSGKVPLKDFLTYGPRTDSQVLLGFLTGWPPFGDNTYYIGLLPLFFVLWGVFHVRSPPFWAFLITALALILLSLGGSSARIVYYFPTMSVFRHIGLVYGPVKFLLLLCGGFGLDRLVQWLGTGTGPVPRISWAFFPALALAAFIPLDSWSASALPEFKRHWRQETLNLADLNFLLVSGRFLLYFTLAGVILALARLGILRHGYWPTGATAGLALVLLADAGSYRYLTLATMPRLRGREVANLRSFLARTPAYCEQRQEKPSDPLVADMIRLYLALPPPARHNNYTMAYNFLQFDPAVPRFRTDQISKKVHQLLQARGGRPRQSPDNEFLPAQDDWLLEALGCSGPKLKMTTETILVPGTRKQVLETIRHIPPSSKYVVLRNCPPNGSNCGCAPEAVLPHLEYTPRPQAPGTVEVLQFSKNTLLLKAKVPAGTSAWLYYADSWHKDWRCTLNGEPSEILEANHAFKAVSLGEGETSVRFSFDGGIRCPLSRFLAFFGIIMALAGIAYGTWAIGRREDPASEWS